MKSHTVPVSEHGSRWQWWFGAMVAAAAFVLGAAGMWQYETTHAGHPDIASVLYHTLQLFILHAPHLEHGVPWQLHVGRLLAAGLVFAAAAKAFMKVFRDDLLLLRLWWPRRRGHVVVCGLGGLGLRLALDGRRRGRFVVAIEKDPAPGARERASASGVLVLEGDARDPALLRKARLDRAEFLVAVCKEDETNVAVAALAGQIARPGKEQTTSLVSHNDEHRARPDKQNAVPLVCRLLINDSKLRAAVNKSELFPHTGPHYRVNLSDLDLEDTAARQALRLYPLDFGPIRETDDTVVHLVVIGFGQMGQSMALHAARIGHFANEVGKPGKRLRITVVDNEPAAWNGFEAKYHNLARVCDADFAAHDFNDAGFVAEMAALCPEIGAHTALVTYAICFENDDPANLRLGLELSKQTANRPAQVLIHQKSRSGLAALFPPEGRGSALSQRVHAFGMEEDVFSWDVLLHESEDRLARAFHENYQVRSGGQAIHHDWDDLEEEYKESNRQAADHISIKLHALGLHESPLRERTERIEKFDESQRDLLARMEHARWCAERFLSDWQYGKPTDRKRKINECLVPWDQLEDKDKKKDWDQIEAIPKILQSVGRGIYR